MDIIGAVERNPKVALGAIGVLTGLNIISLTISGVYVRSVNKACKENREVLEDIKQRLDKFNDSLEMLDDEEEAAEE